MGRSYSLVEAMRNHDMGWRQCCSPRVLAYSEAAQIPETQRPVLFLLGFNSPLLTLSIVLRTSLRLQ